MKKLIFLLAMVAGLTATAQDTIKVAQQDIDEIISAMDTLVQQDSVNNVLILQLKSQILNYEMLAKKDSLILDYRNTEIELLNDRLLIYEDRLDKVDVWYEKRWFGILTGVLGTVGIIHVLDYSLPE